MLINSEKFSNVSICCSNKQLYDQNVRNLLDYEICNIALLIPKFKPSDSDVILRKI